MLMRAEQAQYPDRQSQQNNNYPRYFADVEVFTYWYACFCMKKNCSKSPSDGFRTMNQSWFCANIFSSCNINSWSFSRSAMSTFLCSSKILSIFSCIRNSLSWNDCNWFRCNSSSRCWNELFGCFSLRVFFFLLFPALTCFQIRRLLFLLYHCFL